MSGFIYLKYLYNNNINNKKIVIFFDIKQMLDGLKRIVFYRSISSCTDHYTGNLAENISKFSFCESFTKYHSILALSIWKILGLYCSLNKSSPS